MTNTKIAPDLHGKTVLLVISGGIAAYKSLELIRLIRKSGGHVRCVLTKGGEKFVTPLSVSSLCEEVVYTDLWSLKDETEMGHINLSREADLIVIAPASADILAKAANGLANDLATTMLLAVDKPVLFAPAMNHKMWMNPATQENVQKLQSRGYQKIGPNEGDMACGEYGFGRMSEPTEILSAITSFFFTKPLEGLRALVTAGPTFEAIDPVRYIGNRSSGKQGYEIARALHSAGAQVTLISGPVHLPPPPGVKTINVESAQQMQEACEATLPADIVLCAAAVADWRVENAQSHKIKKREGDNAPVLTFIENPDILKTITHHKQRPTLVIGFAAETENLLDNARAKLKRKGCDWILANDVSENNKEKVFGADTNHVYLIKHTETVDLGHKTKQCIAQDIARKIADYFEGYHEQTNAAQ